MWTPDVSAKSTAKRTAAGTFGQKDHRLSLSVIAIARGQWASSQIWRCEENGNSYEYTSPSWIVLARLRRRSYSFVWLLELKELLRRCETFFTKTKNPRSENRKGESYTSPETTKEVIFYEALKPPPHIAWGMTTFQQRELPILCVLQSRLVLWARAEPLACIFWLSIGDSHRAWGDSEQDLA